MVIFISCESQAHLATTPDGKMEEAMVGKKLSVF
jgi:hypothetical protein